MCNMGKPQNLHRSDPPIVFWGSDTAGKCPRLLRLNCVVTYGRLLGSCRRSGRLWFWKLRFSSLLRCVDASPPPLRFHLSRISQLPASWDQTLLFFMFPSGIRSCVIPTGFRSYTHTRLSLTCREWRRPDGPQSRTMNHTGVVWQ